MAPRRRSGPAWTSTPTASWRSARTSTWIPAPSARTVGPKWRDLPGRRPHGAAQPRPPARSGPTRRPVGRPCPPPPVHPVLRGTTPACTTSPGGALVERWRALGGDVSATTAPSGPHPATGPPVPCCWTPWRGSPGSADRRRALLPDRLRRLVVRPLYRLRRAASLTWHISARRAPGVRPPIPGPQAHRSAGATAGRIRPVGTPALAPG